MSKYQKMILIEPSIEYDEQIQAFRKEFLAYEGSMDDCESGRTGCLSGEILDRLSIVRRMIHNYQRIMAERTHRKHDQLGRR